MFWTTISSGKLIRQKNKQKNRFLRKAHQSTTQTKKKKKENENGVIGDSGGGTQTIIIRQPIEFITSKPGVVKVDSTKPKT